MKNILKIVFIILIGISLPVLAQPPQAVAAKHGMVVTEQELASKIGLQILVSGGNAVDAAVAVGYALAVVYPCCGNLGGGGFMTLRLKNGKTIFINFRERAPLAATPNMFLDAKGNIIPGKSTNGYLAVAVPGTVLGLDTALKKFGTMTRKQVMAPAIALADRGFLLKADDVKLFHEYTQEFKEHPNIAAIFLKNQQPYQVGDRFIQKDLAHTLKLIADEGPQVFYKGVIAKTIVEASRAHHGILSMKDFSDYSIQELPTLNCTYKKFTIISAPPPSSGGITLCEMLNILESYPLKSLGYQSVQGTHYEIEAMRYAFFDRNNQLGDPDFVNNPAEQLISSDHADHVRQNILDVRASSSSELGAKPEHQEHVHTTHYSIVDKFGNAVAVTYTLNSFFGAGVIAGQTGFFLNNEMDDFTLKPGKKNQFGLIQGSQNSIQAGKRPLSSMTPTIITKRNNLFMIVGSRGGPRIITGTLLTILNVIDYGMDIQSAVNAPRFHHQWLPDVIDIEDNTFSSEIRSQLMAMGYHFTIQKPWGAVEAIYIAPDTKMIYGANDRRQAEGKALGY